MVKNAFVGAVVSNGLITIYKGNPLNKEQLSFIEHSYLTVAITSGSGQVQYYSNSIQGGLVGQGTVHPIDVPLQGDKTTQIKDTIKTVWKESGFDIVQKVYPVAFTSSGVIVISVSIVNHGGLAITAQAQYLLDNMNSNTITPPLNANDNPFLIERYGAINTWTDCPFNPIPSFYLAFENGLTSLDLGTVGIGYMNDSFPPRPIGLLPLSFLEFGDWGDQVYYTWGPPDGADRSDWNDEATLMMSQLSAATPFEKGVSDSVTEIMRTAYGTPEWCYQHGNIFGFALYPQHINWDPFSGTYSPNPFQVETFLFNVNISATSNTTIRQTVGEPIHIVNPPPAGPTSDTTQQQNVPSISGDGFSTATWTDSVLVLPSGCASSFPVDINFDVKAGDIGQPIFVAPWDCSIQVDCANPDTLPPAFQNSFTGCDSITRDTVIVQDGRQPDLGIDTITYTSKDMAPAQYSVTLNPPPPYKCTNGLVNIYVHQIDTFKSGHVIFTFTDCAKNISYDTLCFTAHSPLPDKTPPIFWIDSTVADCHAKCTEWSVTDTATSATSIDRGIDSLVIVSSTNMTLSGVPNGGKYPATDTTEVFFRVCVTDSLLDGQIILRASDTSHNFRLDTITYCTTPDKTPPLITKQDIDLVTGKYHIHTSDTQAWDRGVDSVWIEQLTNMVTVPSPIPNPIGCKPTYDFDLHVADTSQCASARVFVKDCAGNIDSILPIITYTKGAKPVVVASKTTLCTTADSAVLDAGPNFTAYLWTTGQTTEKITVGKGTYSVTVQEGAGCPATSDPVVITLSPATTQITPAGPIAVCSPDSVQLDGGGGFASYQWFNTGSLIPGETSEKIWATKSGSYTVQVTNGSGCSGTSPAVSVTINPLPPTPVITAVNSLMTSTQALSYQWSRNGTTIPGATQQTYLDTVGGIYTVTITDANGCSSTSLPFSNAGTTQIAVAYPAVVYAHESNHLTIPLSILSSAGLPPAGPVRSFTAVISFNKTLLIPTGPPSDPGATMSMSVGSTDNVVTYTDATSQTAAGSVIANLPFIAALGNDSCTAVTIQSFKWAANNISVTLQDGKFCDTDLCQQGGTRLIDPDGTVSISAPRPNPAYSSVQIDYRLIEHGKTTLIISDLLGREVLRLVDSDQEPGTYSVDADISALPTGTYIYSLRTPTIVKSNHLEITR